MTTRLNNKLMTQREEVKKAYQNGATLRQIGEVHAVSAGTVRNVLKEMGVPMRSRGRRRKADTTDPRILPVEAPVEGAEAPSDYEGNF
jgi:hypothetical protein